MGLRVLAPLPLPEPSTTELGSANSGCTRAGITWTQVAEMNHQECTGETSWDSEHYMCNCEQQNILPLPENFFLHTGNRAAKADGRTSVSRSREKLCYSWEDNKGLNITGFENNCLSKAHS